MWKFVECFIFNEFKIFVFEVKAKPYLMVTVFRHDMLMGKLFCRPDRWIGKVHDLVKKKGA